MRNFILILNCVGIADYYSRARAESAFARKVRQIKADDMLELYDLNTGRRICSTI